MAEVELLIKPRWIVPVEPAGQVLEHHALAVDEGRIVALVPAGELDQFQPLETADLPGHALLPGLVNAHTHAPMSLLRGLADDLPLREWLEKHVWPAESRFVGPEFVRDGADAGIAEMLKGGVTCFNDMYFFPDVVAQRARQAGMRACVGLIVIDFPTAWAKDRDEYFQRAGDVRDALRGDDLLRTAFAPHAPYTVGDESLQRLRMLADEMELPVHMHVHETAGEVADAERQYGKRSLARLKDLGFLNPGLMAVHMTQLTQTEIADCADTGVHVIHCPESNLKLASGICQVTQLQAAGVNVALGTDGAASNNDLDLLGEMKTAALLAKGASGDPGALPAQATLEMATLNGARALGWQQEIGSLVAGKSADCIALDLDRLETQPLYDVISQLVYAAGRQQVTDVWVKGERLLQEGALTRMDETAITRRAQEWGLRIVDSKEATA